MRSRTTSLLAALAAAAVLLPTAGAHADETLARPASSTDIKAAGGAVAWLEDGELVFRLDDPDEPAGVVVGRLGERPADGFDVGVNAAGQPEVVWRESRSLFSRRLPGAPRLRLTVLPAGARHPAVWGKHVAYVQRRGGCDVPVLRNLKTGATRRLDRGRCAKIRQLDLNARWVGVLASIDRRTEARVIRTSGGPSRRVQRESQGEESNAIGAIALDGDRLFTTRTGIRQENVLTRHDLGTGRRSDARAFLTLSGAVARTRGRTYYGTSGVRYDERSCGGSCAVVEAEGDPWSATSTRLLPPQITLEHPGDQYVDEPAAFTGALFRKRVSRTAELGREPVGGAAITLTQEGRPTSAKATSAGDGTWSAAIPAAELGTLLQVGATSDVASTPTLAAFFAPVFARIALAGERQGDGSIVFRGTVSPAQPGRKVRIDRRDDALCATMRPPRAPEDCPVFTQDPVITGPLTDGSFEVTAPAGTPAGVFRASLDFLRDDPKARQGRSNTVPVS